MISSQAILKDVLFFFKTYLSTSIDDPLSDNRPPNQSFIMTSYPQKPVRYPLITIKDINLTSGKQLGFQSEAYFITLDIEIRIWARTVKERDELADQVFDKLRTNQYNTTSGSIVQGLHDLQLISSINVNDPDGAKSKIMTWRVKFVAC